MRGFTIINGYVGYYENGGGIYGNGTHARISKCIITGNSAYRGGGLHRCNGSITNCIITDNTADDYGAGLARCNGEITNCMITGNSAGGGGGGLYYCNDSITNCIITGNTANSGGGLYDCRGSKTNCTITDNTATSNGGGFYSCSGAVTNCTISGNTAYYYGGGLYSCNGSITNCTITGNTAINMSGGGFYDGGGALINCTIANNTANEYGGGLYDYDGSITNCIIWANSNDQLFDGSNPTYSCIQDWTRDGAGNIISDPLFVDGPGNDLHLQPWSYCIDTGTNSPPRGLPATDMDGNHRPIDGDNDGQAIADMGAYEVSLSNEPVIWFSEFYLKFSAEEGETDPDDQILTIRNVGMGTLNWSITENCNWLTAAPANGSSTGESDEVTLSVDITGLMEGLYTCDLTITDPGAMNSTQTVNVNLQIGALHVPSQYPTIQAAIDAANPDGDTVVVATGTYYENINFNGKNIILTSTDPSDPNVVTDTIIDGGSSGSVVTFSGTETGNCELKGFTIQNGNTDGYGGGICGGSYPDFSNAAISNCVITGNSAPNYGYGGGLYECNGPITNCTISDNNASVGGGLAYCDGSITNCTINSNEADSGGGGLRNCDGPITNCMIADNSTYYGGGGLDYCHNSITNCTITGNTTKYYGGGIRDCDGPITNCIITNNTANDEGGGLHNCDGRITNCIISGNYARDYGGGLYNCNDTITNCTITNNTANYGGGLSNSNGTITNCIIWGNMANSYDQLYNCSNPTFSCIQEWDGGGIGNISSDPLFVKPDNGDFHLQPFSYCIDAGTNSPPGSLPATDLDENPRPVDGDKDGQAIADMGAYEVCLSNEPHIWISEFDLYFSAMEGGTDPDDQIFTIRNIGWGTLNWSITEDRSWLTVTPDSGSTSGPPDQVTLSVDITGLTPGIYTCDLTIMDPCAINNPQTVNVNLGIGPDVPYLYPTIQSAIDAAFNGDTITVANGTYTGQGNRDINFKGKSITVKSANGPENCIIDCQGTAQEPHRGFNLLNLKDIAAVIDGFTIINGYGSYHGGGIYCHNSDPVITNCKFINCYAEEWGGALYTNSSPVITNCIFKNNSAGWEGGAITIRSYWGYITRPLIDNCLITHNTASVSGGGINCDVLSTPTIKNCIITGNSTGYYGGGGVVIWQSNPTISNCLITGNSTTGWGSGIRQSYEFEDGSKIYNCTITGNRGEGNDGSGIFCNAEMTIANSILRDNIDLTPGDYIWTDAEVTFNYCNLPQAHGNNISADPLFEDPNNGDFHLLPSSPCIDTGNPNYIADPNETDLDGNPRITDGDEDGQAIVDMGVYEYIPSIEVQVKLTPQTLNCSSKGKWIKAHFVLPEEFSIEDVDTDKPATIDSLTITSDHINVFYNDEGLVEIEIAFSRTDFCTTVPFGNIELTVRGFLIDGTGFHGTDTIRITTNQLEKLPEFLSHWLQTDCLEPDYCNGFDLDQNSTVDLADFALLAEN